MGGDGIRDLLGVGGCRAVCDGRSARNDGVELEKSTGLENTSLGTERSGLLQQLTCVTWTVRVVCSPPGAGVVSGAPVIAATDESEASSDEASVLVRTVVETGTISVATELPAGQLVMLAAQDVTVYRLVAYTVEVTSWTEGMEELPMGKGLTPVLLEGG